MTERKRLMALIVVMFCCNVCAGNVHAAWSSDPSVNNAICTATNDQSAPKIISDGSGGGIIIWIDDRSGNHDIYAQRIDASGVAQWTADGVAICTSAESQVSPAIISDGSGGAIITWTDYRSGSGNSDIYAQRINASGVIQWTANGVAICTATNDQIGPSITSDGNGGAIITWMDMGVRGGSYYDIYAQRINAGGVAQWTANGVAICTSVNDKSGPQIISDSSGGAIITWQDYRSGSNYNIYAQRINAGGVVQWTANGVAICTATNDQSGPQIISDGSGGAIITWNDYRSGIYSPDIYAQRINASGVVQWTANGVAICTLVNDQLSPTIINDGSGGAIIAWMDYHSGSGTYDIYAQMINASGVVQWTANGVVICTAINNQENPTITSDGSGGAIITWQDSRSVSSYDIYAQRINAGGGVQWTANGVAICTATGSQYDPAIISNGSSGAIITWWNYRSGSSYDIYAQRINGSGTLTTVVEAPVPDIKANELNGWISVSSGTHVSITASLSPGTETGTSADWWIAASTPWGWYSLNLSGWTWTPGINLLFQSPLVSVSPVEIYGGLLPAGDHVFCFGVDMSPNGVLDSPLYYDFVQVHVTN